MTEPIEREEMACDVVIVGAGPAGLATAIRIKQHAAEQGGDVHVILVEKAAEIGGHILSGAVMDPVGLDELIPDWRGKGAPVGPDVTEERLHFLTGKSKLTFPNLFMPPQMKTAVSTIISLGDLCKWLAAEAEALGVEIYPATAAVDLVTDEKSAVAGIVTGDLGMGKQGPKDTYMPGIILKAKYTILTEGAHGSLAKKLIPQFGLDAGRSPQKYSIGLKEIWEIPAEKHQPGRVDNFLGFPLDDKTNGGGFLYHAQDNRIYIGQVVYLDYANPTLSPFDEFQRLKTHPFIADLLDGGTRLSYGARAIASGGWQSLPQLAFPGGALAGCDAGMMNVPRLKGIHNALRSGRAVGEQMAAAVLAGRGNDLIDTLHGAVMKAGIEADLKPVRNVKPLWSRHGMKLGVLGAGIDMWTGKLFGFSPFGTLKHEKPDFAATRHIGDVAPKTYQRPDGNLTFDRSASVFLANLAHDEDQPVHLKLSDPSIPIEKNLPDYGEPAPLYCPAGVYEMVPGEEGPQFRINAANCVHCKTCDIKDPAQNITWVPPEGGSGPNYSGM